MKIQFLRIMKKSFAGFLFVLGVVSILASGAATESENIRTDGIYSDILVTGNGNGTTDVNVNLNVGGITGTDLILSDADRLTASAIDENHVLSEKRTLFDYRYGTTFDFNEGDTLFTISLKRDEGKSAGNSTVLLPLGFDIESPADGMEIKGGEEVTFIYAPSGTKNDMSVFVDCHCKYRSESGRIISRMRFPTFMIKEDDGSVTYSLEQLTGSYDPEKYDEGCEFKVKIARISYGVLDENYGEGGHIIARQERTVNFKYQPGSN